jgi:hypothetical protein
MNEKLPMPEKPKPTIYITEDYADVSDIDVNETIKIEMTGEVISKRADKEDGIVITVELRDISDLSKEVKKENKNETYENPKEYMEKISGVKQRGRMRKGQQENEREME